jgi:fatty-acyl-CoA synthase
MAFALPDAFNISQHDVMMPIAPMFHANAHGVPHVAVLLGCKIVFPGRHCDAEHLLELICTEGATFTTAVPTVWNMLLEAIEKDPGRWNIAKNFRGGVGGTAVPEALMRKLAARGIHLSHLWGMTETTPIATVCTVKAHMKDWPEAQQRQVLIKQGRPLPFVDLRVVNEQGEVPWDGKTPGELQTRGPFVAGSYFNAPETADRWTTDGWLRTGDVATIDAEGYMQICDRAKDLIKSGGEWISSVDLENALAAHPAVREAGVVGVPHPKWDERPVAVVVLRPKAAASPEELRSFLSDRFAKWQLPDAFVFVDELPHTSTGKLSKLDLRKQYANWQWDTAGVAR